MDKKGQILSWLLVIIVITIIFILVRSSEVSVQKGSSTFIGEEQLNLLSSYAEINKEMFYLDQVAKYAAYSAIFDLGANGGFDKNIACGESEDYPIWDLDNTVDCYPKYRENFFAIFSQKLKEGLRNTKFSKINYDFFIDGRDIIGYADSRYETNLIFNNEELGHVSSVASFRIYPGIDLDTFDELKVFVQRCKSCQVMTTMEPMSCIKTRITQFNTMHPGFEMSARILAEGTPKSFINVLDADVMPVDEMFLFDVASKDKLIRHQNGAITYDGPVIRFASYLG